MHIPASSMSEQMLERPLPHNGDAERAILGSIILDNSLVNQAIELLRSDDFYVRAHQFVFRAMLSLSERGGEINPILLGEELKREGALEQTGGVSFISELTYGLPHFTNVAAYAKVVKDKSLMRQLVKVANKITSEALEEEDEALSVLDRCKEHFTSLCDQYIQSESTATPLITSFSDFMRLDFNDGEEVAFHARRGELVLVQSVTNHGKSTLIRNAAISLATGGKFPPVIEFAAPCRVLLLNFEGAGGWFQSDLRLMTRGLTEPEISLLRENFFPVHAPCIEGEPISLSRHMGIMKSAARRAGGVDVLVIDTLSAAFSIRNENDNAEVANHVMKPLVKLARQLNCLVILVHHVGKAKAEEGSTREQAHRGRGASAWGDFSTSIFNLDADPHDKERVKLTCGKRKNGPNYEKVLRLDRDGRWFKATDEMPAKPETSEELVLKAMESTGLRELRTKEIIKALDGKVATRTVMDCLKRLHDSGSISKTKRGRWALVEICATCALPYTGLHNCTISEESQSSTPNPLSTLPLPLDGNGFYGDEHVNS
jgi:replicative DNA helicase